MKKRFTENAELLEETAEKYFQQCDSRYIPKLGKNGLEEIPSPAPYTFEGLCGFLGILRSEFDSYCREATELGRCCLLLRQKIIGNRVTGALLGDWNATFAAASLKCDAPELYGNAVVSDTESETAKMLEEWRKLWKEETENRS